MLGRYVSHSLVIVLRALPDALVGFFGLVAAGILLKHKGFPCLYRRVRSWPLGETGNVDRNVVERICSTVDKASLYCLRHVGCLRRSAVTTCLLRFRGVPAQLVIGVRKSPFESHAWVEVSGQVVSDHTNVRQYYSVVDLC